MKRFFLALAVICFSVGSVSAIDLFKKKNSAPVDYNAWRDTTSLPAASENGLTLFYPETVDDGQAVVRGEISLPGCSAEQIFLGALDYAVTNLDSEEDHEQIGEINDSDLSFMMRIYSKQGSNNTETVFTWLVMVKAEAERLLFAANEIDAKYREKGILPRTIPFEKLNPGSNLRHSELVMQFVDINSTRLHSIAKAAAEAKNLKVNHWTEIAEKKAVKGMNELEVKLAMGLPLTTRESGERIRWVYPDNFVVLFEDGQVVRVVE